MNSIIAAHVFTLLVVIVIAFQIALAAGAPWGHLTWGGKFSGRLPAPMRCVTMFSAVLLATFALMVKIRAGVRLNEWQPTSRLFIWVVIGYCAQSWQ